MCLASKYTVKLSEDVNKINIEINRLYNVVSLCDRRISDIMHVDIEFNNSIDMYSAWLIVKELKEIRQKRRQAKDEIEKLRIIKTHLDRVSILNILENAQKSINSEQEKMQHRKYSIRIAADKIAEIKI